MSSGRANAVSVVAAASVKYLHYSASYQPTHPPAKRQWPPHCSSSLSTFVTLTTLTTASLQQSCRRHH